jgi:hypothetical protein
MRTACKLRHYGSISYICGIWWSLPTVLLPEKVGVIRPISRDPREEEGAESPELKPRPLIATTSTNLNRVNNNNNNSKELIVIEKASVNVPVESWLKNTQVGNFVTRNG